jgi:predicted ester cyclase
MVAYYGCRPRRLPHFTNRIEQVFSEADKAFARLTFSGSHEGEMFGMAPTRNAITYALLKQMSVKLSGE